MNVHPSEIVSVIVYREGAFVTRKARVTSIKDFSKGFSGSFSLNFGPVPMAVHDESVRVRVEDGGSIKIPSCTVALSVISSEETALSRLKDELRAAQKKTAVSESEKTVLMNSLSIVEEHMEIETRGDGKEGEPPLKVPIEVRKSLISYRIGHRKRIADTLAALELTIGESKKIERDLQRQIDEASSKDKARENEVSKIVSVLVELPSGETPADSVDFYCSYYVPGAMWVPSYGLTFAKDFSSVDLTMNASVAQNTTEDWTGVHIQLSTASWLERCELPELKALKIGHSQQEPPSIGWRPLPPGLDDLYKGYDQAFKGKSISLSSSTIPVSEVLYDEESVDDTFRGFCEGALPPEPCCEPAPEMCDEVENFLMAPPPPCSKAPAPMRSEAPARPPSHQPKMKERVKMKLSRERASKKMASKTLSPMTGGNSDHAKSLSPSAPGGGGHAPCSVDKYDDSAVSTDLLDYGSLVMPAPHLSGRGKLRPLDAAAKYSLSKEEQKVLARLDLSKIMRDAVKRGRRISRIPLPAGHSLPLVHDDFVYMYPGEAVADIPSDNSFHTVSILTCSSKTRLSYVTAPRITEEVFKVASFENSLSRPLPSGPCDVTVGSRFVLRTGLSAVPARATVDIGLGVEQAVKVIRNTTYSENEEGFISSEFNLEHTIEIELKNTLPEDIEVEVRERIPYAPQSADNIDVKVVSVDPPWKEFTQKEQPICGSYVWKVPVPSGEKARACAHYVIQIPSSYELAGGNRREV